MLGNGAIHLPLVIMVVCIITFSVFQDAKADDIVGSSQKISEIDGGFLKPLDDEDVFGHAVNFIGDFNGDGIQDLVVGADEDDDGGDGRGAFYILFMNADATVRSYQKISDTQGGFSGFLDNEDHFGHPVINIGDLDGDGVTDLAVGAFFDDDGGTDRGAVWILFMNSDGTVKSHQKISDTDGGFEGILDDFDKFGITIDVFDLDGDGVTDLAVGASGDDDGSTDFNPVRGKGAVWILFLNSDGTVKSHQKISDTAGGFGGNLDDNDQFGHTVSYIEDLDGDGVTDLAVGAHPDDDGGINRGAFYILFLNSDGTVKSHQKISDTQGGFSGVLDDNDQFGHAVNNIGDLDGDGVTDLAVGAHFDDDGGTDRGAFYILFLNSDGTVKSHQKISDTDGGFEGNLDDGDDFSHYIDETNDFDGDGIIDLVVGATGDDDGGTDRGAFYILFLNSDGTVKSEQKISDTQGGFGELDMYDWFGKDVASVGDLDNDGIVDLAVGAHGDDEGCAILDINCNTGAIYILFMNNDGTVKSEQKITANRGGFSENLDEIDFFGYSLAGIGDFDGDGVSDLIATAFLDDDGGTDRGAFYILFLNSDGTVKSHEKISDTQGGFSGVLEDGDHFGHVVNQIGDLDGDGVLDLAVGAEDDDDGGTDRGAVWILFMNSDGTVKSHQKISDTDGGFSGVLEDGDGFGHDVHLLDDLDGDGINELVVGSELDNDGGTDRGAVWILFMNSDGTVKSFQTISDTEGGFEGDLDNGDHFGVTVDNMGDLDGDGIPDLAVGADNDDDGGTDRGAFYILFLNSDGTVKSHQKISDTDGGFEGMLDNNDNFGHRLVRLDDHNGDGLTDLFVSAFLDDDGGTNKGAVWVLFLNQVEPIFNNELFCNDMTIDELIASGLYNVIDNRGGSSAILIGTAGDDLMLGSMFGDEFRGGPGNDCLIGGTGDDTMHGWVDNDWLYGREGNDWLLGWSGDDFLDGGSGADELRGDQGTDTCKIDSSDTFVGSCEL